MFTASDLSRAFMFIDLLYCSGLAACCSKNFFLSSKSQMMITIIIMIIKIIQRYYNARSGLSATLVATAKPAIFEGHLLYKGAQSTDCNFPPSRLRLLHLICVATLIIYCGLELRCPPGRLIVAALFTTSQENTIPIDISMKLNSASDFKIR